MYGNVFRQLHLLFYGKMQNAVYIRRYIYIYIHRSHSLMSCALVCLYVFDDIYALMYFVAIVLFVALFILSLSFKE